jgi:hypothetical protein
METPKTPESARHKQARAELVKSARNPPEIWRLPEIMTDSNQAKSQNLGIYPCGGYKSESDRIFGLGTRSIKGSESSSPDPNQGSVANNFILTNFLRKFNYIS